VTGFFAFRTCRKLAFVNGREAKKATKREAVRLKALGKEAIQGCRRSEMKPTIPVLKLAI
jgi:hypothetical protein